MKNHEQSINVNLTLGISTEYNFFEEGTACQCA